MIKFWEAWLRVDHDDHIANRPRENPPILLAGEAIGTIVGPPLFRAYWKEMGREDLSSKTEYD